MKKQALGTLGGCKNRVNKQFTRREGWAQHQKQQYDVMYKLLIAKI
jgi:hypothetical protein